MRITLFGGVPLSLPSFSKMIWATPINLCTSEETQETVYKPFHVKPLATHNLRTKPRRQSVMRGK